MDAQIAKALPLALFRTPGISPGSRLRLLQLEDLGENPRDQCRQAGHYDKATDQRWITQPHVGYTHPRGMIHISLSLAGVNEKAT